MFIFKDYQIIQKKLCRFALNDQKHLMWKFGGVPCIDKKVWDKVKDQVEEIYIRTKKGRRFRVDARDFDAKKIEIDLGFGKQYYIEREVWDISEKVAKKKPEPVAELPLSDRKYDESPMDVDDIVI